MSKQPTLHFPSMLSFTVPDPPKAEACGYKASGPVLDFPNSPALVALQECRNDQAHKRQLDQYDAGLERDEKLTRAALKARGLTEDQIEAIDRGELR